MGTRGADKSIKDPRYDPASFGNIALEFKYITEYDLKVAIARQEARLPLGEILVQQGKLTSYQRDEILLEQARRKATSCNEIATIELRKQRNMIEYFQHSITEVAVATHAVTMLLSEAIKNHK